MKKNRFIILMFALLILALTGCAPLTIAHGIQTVPPAATPQASQTQVTTREAEIESVEIRFSPSDPQQVSAIVRGHLNDACSTLQSPQVSYESGAFQIKLMVITPTDRGCIQIISPFEQSIALDTTALTPGTYTVTVNGVSTTFSFPAEAVPQVSSLQLVVRATDGSLQIAYIGVPLDPTARPTFGKFLSNGGGAEGNAYVLDSSQNKAVVTDGKGFNDLEFVQGPTTYGLAVWPGDGNLPPRLAWATQDAGNRSSTIKISSPDGTYFDTLLTQDLPNPPSQLMAQFFSPDGKWLYFSKEPIGIGGYILFSGASSLYKINLNTREVVDVIGTDLTEEPTGCLDDISGDFRYVADHCAQDFISIRDLVSGGTSKFTPPAGTADGYRLAGSARFSPDGKKLAYALGKSAPEDEQGWVVVSDASVDTSRVILTSPAGSYYLITGWLDNQTLLVESVNPLDCTPYCKSQLWTVKADGSEAQKAAEGSFLAAIPNDAIIQLPVEPPPTPAVAACKDAAEYISDDGLDGATYAPNTAFTKTWTVKNTGTCSWDSRYLVYQISGAFMTQQPGYWLVPPDNTVEPGQTVDIQIGMTSPPAKGNYTSYWGLKNEAGEIIPIKGGADGNSFYVEITVKSGNAETGAVTATAIDIVPEQGSGDACTSNSTYFVHAYITTDGPTTASYEIGSTAGQIPAGYFEDNGETSYYLTDTIVFDEPGTKTVNLRFVGPYPYPDDITVSLRVNGGEWINTRLYCP